jgi:hypothetical protein
LKTWLSLRNGPFVPLGRPSLPVSLRADLWRSNLFKHNLGLGWQNIVTDRLLRFARNDTGWSRLLRFAYTDSCDRKPPPPLCHCEPVFGEAICLSTTLAQNGRSSLQIDCFASLAMTGRCFASNDSRSGWKIKMGVFEGAYPENTHFYMVSQFILKKLGSFMARFRSPDSLSLPCINDCMALAFPVNRSI